MNWEIIINNVDTVLIGIMTIVTGASILLKWVAPMTKTPLDDDVYVWLVKALQFLSIADKNVKQVKIKIKK